MTDMNIYELYDLGITSTDIVFPPSLGVIFTRQIIRGQLLSGSMIAVLVHVRYFIVSLSCNNHHL